MDLTLVVACGLTLGILTAFLGAGLLIGKRQVSLEKRIDEYAASASAEQFQEREKGLSAGSSVTVPRGSFTRYIRAELARADLALTVKEFFSLNLMTTVLGFLLAFALFRGNLLLALAGMVGGLIAPIGFVRYSQGRRQAAFSSQLENTIVHLANAIRSGYGLMQAIESVGKQMPPPTSDELNRVGRESALGVPLDTALTNLVRRNPSVDLDLVVTAIKVSHVSGGNLADVLDSIAGTIRDRVRIAGEIQAITSQQRFSAMILTFLPAGLGLVLFAVNPEYFAPLWQTSCGLTMIAAGVILIFIGNLIIRRIIAIDY